MKESYVFKVSARGKDMCISCTSFFADNNCEDYKVVESCIFLRSFRKRCSLSKGSFTVGLSALHLIFRRQ
jgi:hypothetical protein